MKGYVELDGVENSYLRNEEDKPVAVIGLDNIVVVNTPHGILVTRKDLSQKVKDIATKVQEK
jgi:mannose-1-phosphate guanylyltransferase